MSEVRGEITFGFAGGVEVLGCVLREVGCKAVGLVEADFHF